VSKKLIDKKKFNPNIHIYLLIDGLVSLLMQKSSEQRSPFENNTIKMINEMDKAGINRSLA